MSHPEERKDCKTKFYEINYPTNYSINMDFIRTIDEFRELVDRNKYTIVCFISSKITSGSVVEPTYTRITTAIPTEMLSIVIINLNESPAISSLADVEEEMLLVFMNGKEIARHPGIAPDQLEYVVSKTLCGLGEIKEGFTQGICSRN